MSGGISAFDTYTNSAQNGAPNFPNSLTTNGLTVSGSSAASFPAGITTASFLAPTVQKFLSSSGTYTTPTNRSPLYIEIEMAGGGGGGGSAGQTNFSGASGGISTFGTSLLVANGGVGGYANTASPGGTASLGSGPIGLALSGGPGAGSFANAAITTIDPIGATGGANALGGSGVGALSAPGGNAVANTGAGGGGGSASAVNSLSVGSGGGAGGYIRAKIIAPAATYAYVVGTGGAGGTAGTSGTSGGSGGSGLILVTEFYQ